MPYLIIVVAPEGIAKLTFAKVGSYDAVACMLLLQGTVCLKAAHHIAIGHKGLSGLRVLLAIEQPSRGHDR